MTKVRIFSAAACAALLGATAAAAQSQEGLPHTVMGTNQPADGAYATQLPMSADEGMDQTMTYESSPAMSDKASAAQEAGVDASTLAPSMDQAPGTVSTETVTNGPVPDTAANRARFGGPNSRAGKMTSPRGN